MYRKRDSWPASCRGLVAAITGRMDRRAPICRRAALSIHTPRPGRLGCEALEDRLALTATSLDLPEDPIAADTAGGDYIETSSTISDVGLRPATASQPPGRVASISQSAVADFSRPDVNVSSSTYDQSVSPRDYLQQVSAWYFGHAT